MSLTPQQQERLKQRIADVMVHQLAPIFTDDVLLTFMARKPGNDEADVLITAETDLQELHRLVDRSMARKAVL